ncbi:MAG: diguanylate cyclase, partial [Bradyrhizobium sp.]|nr:diguanylate cyclase [Bradyrhizobium sp.]
VSLIVESAGDGRYLLANRSAEIILNRKREDATGLTTADIFNPREARLIMARDEAAIKKRGVLTEEHPISTKDGLRLFLTRRATVLGDGGEPQYLIKTYEDVTDRRQTESRMAHMAYHDGLTDLPNRAAFLQALSQMIEACADTGEEFAVLNVDLKGLKDVNDVFGHAIGDKLLIEVARRVHTVARGGVVARLSGDEFGLIIDGKRREVPVADGEAILDAALRAGVDLPFACKGGMCSTCRAKLVEGKAEMELNYSLEPWELQAGFVLTCQARPVTERVVVDYDHM